MKEDIWNDKNLIKTILENGVAVMPTDTIYGLVGKALNEDVVNRIYKIKKRNPDKPFIILISDIKDLEKFSIVLSSEQLKKIAELWSFDLTQDFQPEPISIILDCFDEKLKYLSRETNSLSFRLPNIKSLRNLVAKVGPVIATSANREALPPCKDIVEAKKYFGNSTDLYVDGGTVENKHSKLIKLNRDGSIVVLRD